MADALFGRPGNNPYCHYRALKMAESGLRERVVKVAEAAQARFQRGALSLSKSHDLN